MPVVINEFEIISDQSATSRSESSAQESAPQTGSGTTLHEVENILRRERERLFRVQAY